jgi:hypothetical protein
MSHILQRLPGGQVFSVKPPSSKAFAINAKREDMVEAHYNAKPPLSAPLLPVVHNEPVELNPEILYNEKNYSPALTEYHNTKREIDHYLQQLKRKPQKSSAVERYFKRMEEERQGHLYDTLNRFGFTPDQIQSELALMGKSKELAMDSQQNKALNEAIRAAVPSAADILRNYDNRTGLSVYDILHGTSTIPHKNLEDKLSQLQGTLGEQEKALANITDENNELSTKLADIRDKRQETNRKISMGKRQNNALAETRAQALERAGLREAKLLDDVQADAIIAVEKTLAGAGGGEPEQWGTVTPPKRKGGRKPKVASDS